MMRTWDYYHYLYFRLGVARKVLFGKKCVCDLGEREGEYGRLSWFFIDVFSSI
jgi:hypothetical protein